MAAATAGVAVPIEIHEVKSTQGAQAAMRRLLEAAGQNDGVASWLQIGTPVQVDVAGGTGFVIACPAMTDVATAIIAGISAEAGHNLTTAGVAKILSQGKPQNQPNATIIPGGAWPSDGAIGFHTAEEINVFRGILGDSADDTLAVVAQADLTAIYGLTQDATTKYWYVDKAKTTAALGACVEIVELLDAVGTLHGKVAFRITKAAQQLGI